MDNIALPYLEKVFHLEEAGFVEEAFRLFDKVLEVFEDNDAEMLLEKAKMRFRNGYERDALFDFVSAYAESGHDDIYELILEAYYYPNKDGLRENFQKNMQYLKRYSHYRNDYKDEDIEIAPIWQDEEWLVYFNKKKKVFSSILRDKKEFDKKTEQVAMAINELWIEDVVCLEANFQKEYKLLNMDLPLYMVYDRNYWVMFLQLNDIKRLLEKNRLVFLVGERSFYEYLKESMVVYPSARYFYGFQNYRIMFEQIAREINEEVRIGEKEIESYYCNNVEEINQRIRTGKPKFLFWTSRFTTILQYHTRDCMESVKRLGCEAEILIESDDIHRIRKRDIVSVLSKVQPDIMFCIDHFRFEHIECPKELVWITWIQDLLPNILDKNTPLKLTERDFVMNHFTTWKGIKEIGYREDCLIEAPIPANPYIYKPYELNAEELGKYVCDICFVCHASDVDNHIDNTVKNLQGELKEAIYAVYKGYQAYVQDMGEIFYTKEIFSEYIKGAVQYHYDIQLNPNILGIFAKDMFENFNQRVYRQALVDWILDAGFTNIKLWGSGWEKEEKYRVYAMGVAENGEMLSKIYQASKVVVGNNVMTTSAARAWETMLSGGFYMSNYIPEEEDITDIRKIIDVGKDVVMFYNKDDLIEKLHYYLNHEEERKEMIARGRKAALEHMTYDMLMKRVLKEVAERLEGNEDGR